MPDDSNEQSQGSRCWVPHPSLKDEQGNPLYFEAFGNECNAPGAVGQEPGADAAPPADSGETSDSLQAPNPPPPPQADPSAAPPAQYESPDNFFSDDYYRPLNPMPDYDVYSHLAADGIPPILLDDAFLRVQHNEPPSGKPHPYFGRDFASPTITIKDPVVVFTGQYLYVAVDVEIPSRGFPLHLTRIYRSGPVYFGPWGYNWDHNYNVYLRELADGSIAIWTGELNEDVYTRNATGFESPTGVFRKLEHHAATTLLPERYILSDSAGMQQVFSRPDGWPLSDRIPLSSIEDRHANAHKLSYSPEGRLARVQDHAGRRISFSYGACGLLEKITDHTGRMWRYVHDSDVEHLIAVVTPSTDEFPDGLTTSFEYDRFRTHPALIHNVTKVISPSGEILVTNRYGDEPGADDFARVVHQEYGGYEAPYHATRLQYPIPEPGAINLPSLRVEVIDPGVLHVYTFNYRGDLLDHRFRLVLDGSYRLVIETFQYDKEGNLAEMREPNGLGVVYTHDDDNPDPRARGNVLKVELVAPPTKPAPSRIVQLLKYELNFNRIKSSTDEQGHVTTWVYDHEEGLGTFGDVVRIEYPLATLPDGTKQPRTEKFAYNSFGQLTERVSGEGHRHLYEYAVGGLTDGYQISTTCDADGAARRESIEYDQLGRRTAIVDGLGARLEIAYDELGHVRIVRLPAVGGVVDEMRFFYNDAGGVRREERPRGEFLDAIISEPFISNEYEYDPLGRLKKARYGANTERPLEYTYERDSAGRVVMMANALGQIMRMSFDERGLLLSHTEAAGLPAEAVWHYSYDRNGNRKALIDPAGHRFDYEYDSWDRLIRMTLPGEPDAECTSVELTLNHQDKPSRLRVVGRIAPGSIGTLLDAFTDFDERGRPRERREGSRKLTVTYDRDERAIRHTDQRGNSVVLAYDGIGRVLRAADPLGNTEFRRYDAGGNLVRIETRDVLPDFGGTETFVTTIDYDERQRPVRAIDSLGRHFQTLYDARDFKVADVDPMDRTIRRTYGLAGELLSISSEESPGIAVTHRYGYDLGGRRISYVDPENRATSFEYDGRDRLVATTYPDGRVHKRFYTQMRQVARHETPSGTIKTNSYGPDAGLERIDFLPGVDTAATSPLFITRDGLRRPVRLEQNGVTLEIAYDSALRVISESVNGQTASIAYDDLNGLALLTYPDSRVDRIAFDPLWRPLSITLQAAGSANLTGTIPPGTQLSSNVYRGPQRLARREFHNGLATRLDYDRAQRLTGIEYVNSDSETLVIVRYVYDAADQRRVVWAGPAPLTPTRYDYDGLSRLRFCAFDVAIPQPPTDPSLSEAQAIILSAESVLTAHSESYSLDRSDARTSKRIVDAAVSISDSYALGPAQQISALTRVGQGAGSFPFTFDADGRCTQDERHLYTYNALDQLIEVRTIDTGSVLLAQKFDPAGRVQVRQQPTGTYEQCGLGYRVLQRTTAGSPTIQFTYGVGVDEVLFESTGTLRYPLQDCLSSVLAYAGESGRALERYHYMPFGEPSIWSADGTTPRAGSGIDGILRFGGLPLLVPSLYDARARVYESAVGRFLQPDRLQYFDSASLYVYSHHDPVGFVDPTGEAGILAGLLIAAAVGFVAGIATDGVRQAVQMHEGTRESFDWWELVESGGAGAVIAPLLTVAPELAIPLAGWGIAGGADEISQGHWETGTFDIAMSLFPFAMKGARGATFGRGSIFSAAPEGMSTRIARFGAIKTQFVHPVDGVTRVTHVSDPIGLKLIEGDTSINSSAGGKGVSAVFDGTKPGTWVSPWRASEMGPWRRSMSGYPFRRPYVEFDVRPGELTRPGGLKFLFSRWQRQIPGPVDLTGRNPTFGLLPVEPARPNFGYAWPWMHLPRLDIPFYDLRPSSQASVGALSLDSTPNGGGEPPK